MQAVEDAQSDVRSSVAEITMVLTDRGGRSVTRQARMAFLDEGESGRSLIRFDAPADIRGTAFLTHDRPGDDDQWLFLPALDRVKRIAASKKSGNFVGTEFTYEDLGGRAIDEYRHRWLREEAVEDEAADVVESVPLDENSGYSRIVSWVSIDRSVPLQVEYYDRKGALLKKSRSTGYHQPDGVHWRLRTSEMQNVQNGKSTRLQVETWELGADLDPTSFTVEALREDW
jgi:hypothetical protein